MTKRNFITSLIGLALLPFEKLAPTSSVTNKLRTCRTKYVVTWPVVAYSQSFLTEFSQTELDRLYEKSLPGYAQLKGKKMV